MNTLAGFLYISCLSLVCPVGFTPESAAAAMRAGIAGLTNLPYFDSTGEPIVGAMVPGLADDLRGTERLIHLLALAFEYVQTRLPSEFAWTDLPLFLCTREPARPGAKIKRIVAEVEARQQLNIRRDGSRHIASGPVGAFEALAAVRRLFAEGQVQACLIAAVDTFVDARALRWLDQAQRLKTEVQSDGVIPGEAACLALVSSQPARSSCLVVKGLGFAVEDATVLDEEPLLGKGMAAAVKDALRDAGLAMHEVDFRLSDVAGEFMPSKSWFWHKPASCGEPGHRNRSGIMLTASGSAALPPA